MKFINHFRQRSKLTADTANDSQASNEERKAAMIGQEDSLKGPVLGNTALSFENTLRTMLKTKLISRAFILKVTIMIFLKEKELFLSEETSIY